MDNIFLAQFAVDDNARPYWDGNLKKLKLQETIDALGSKTLTLVDVNNASVIASDGRIAFDVLSYWTDAGSLPPPTA